MSLDEYSVSERRQYNADVKRARNDPVWFMKEILHWKPWPKQEEIVRTFYQHKYNPDLQKYKELVWVSGQRSGKSATIGFMAAYEFFEIASLTDPSNFYGLLPNQNIAVSCIAAGKDQALDGIFSLMRNSIENSEWINHYWDLRILESGRIEYKDKHVFAQVKAARADTGAGYTSKAVFFDELDLFQKNTESKAAAQYVFSKMVNSTMTLGDEGKIVSISSLDNIDGMMSKAYSDALEKKNALTYKLCTWEVNPSPNVTEPALREEFRLNINDFYRFFANMPEVSSGVLFPGPVNLNRNMINVFEMDEIPPEISQHYHVMAVDPAFRNDSFGVSVGYRHGNHIYIDGVCKFQKTNQNEKYILPSDIENFIFEWIPELNVDNFIYDVDLVLGIVEKLDRDWGINTIKHTVDMDAYGRWVNMNDGASPLDLDIVYNDHLLHEAKQLTKEELTSGKIRVDHPNNGSKDIADTVANCIWFLSDHETDVVFKPISFMSKVGFVNPYDNYEEDGYINYNSY